MMQQEPSREPRRRGLLALCCDLRAAAPHLVHLVALHEELAQQEWAQEKARLLQLLLASLLGFTCLVITLLLSCALVVALSWQTPYRIVALLGLLLGHGLVAALAWWRASTLVARGAMRFATTREELAADIALLKSRL